MRNSTTPALPPSPSLILMSVTIAMLLATSIVTGCRSTPGPTPVEEKKFSAQMQSMAADVKTLVPYLYDREEFNKPENHDRVEALLTEFARASHQVERKTGQDILGDPLLVDRTLDHLQIDLTRAVTSFQSGQLEFARSVAKSSLTNCFQCHSVTNVGKSAAWDIDQIPNLKLQPLERADLLVATRKYDKALAFMEEELKTADIRDHHALDFEGLLRRYLALVIRIEANPERALRELNRVAGDVPPYVAEPITAWRRSLAQWTKEKPRPVKKAADVFARAESSFTRAAAAQKFEKDHAGDVEYLRATAVLHGGLKLLKTDEDRARALYLLGRAYEVLDDLGSWNLHESYYEACVTRQPKGKFARGCYDRLDASLKMGFSGSAGTHLPPEEAARLERLRQLL